MRNQRIGSSEFTTKFGSLRDYVKGTIEIVNDDPKNYAFSNVFEVCAKSFPYEKVVVGKNLRYVVEALRAEGTSDWFFAPHDEFALVMDGLVEIDLVKPDHTATITPVGAEGSVKMEREPVGRKMGRMKLGRGHQALLPRGAAYRFRSPTAGVILLQTMLGSHSVQKWAEICYT
jgi:hypothetical protein